MLSPTYHLHREQFIPRPLEEVFAFFSDAHNLEVITPDFLHFKILTPDPLMLTAGFVMDYRLQLFGVPLNWQSRIETFDPPRSFTDVQLRGPYRLWHHVHRFTAVAGGTQMVDEVDYALPLGPLGPVAHALFVRSTLGRIFDYRRDRVAEMFSHADGRMPLASELGAR
jgi:ligand-binding SRPBCC domain-containing protein